MVGSSKHRINYVERDNSDFQVPEESVYHSFGLYSLSKDLTFSSSFVYS